MTGKQGTLPVGIEERPWPNGCRIPFGKNAAGLTRVQDACKKCPAATQEILTISNCEIEQAHRKWAPGRLIDGHHNV
jgi:hypothetical protein